MLHARLYKGLLTHISASWACRPLARVPTKSPIKPLTADHNSSNRNLTVFSFDISPWEDLVTK